MYSQGMGSTSQRNLVGKRFVKGSGTQMTTSRSNCPTRPVSSLLNIQPSGPRFGTSGSVSFHSSTRPTAFLHNPYHGFPPPPMWPQNTGQLLTPENHGYGQFSYNAAGQKSYPLYQGEMMICPDGKISPRHYDYARKVSIRAPDVKKSRMSQIPHSNVGVPDEIRKPTKMVASSQNTASPSGDGDSHSKSHGALFMASPLKDLKTRSATSQGSPILLEIVGILNSQVTELKTIKRKSFSIKDSHGHSVICHYFETDRPLCKMCRGKSYRSVGRFNDKKQVFHTFSVREATAEDVRLYRRLVAVGNTAIKDLKKQSTVQI